MHILLGILGVIAVIAVFVIRANRAAQAGKELVETAAELKNVKRRYDWNRQSGKRTSDLVDDPRVAAMAMMYAVAAGKGELSKTQHTFIVSESSALFRSTERDSEEFFGQARWQYGQIGDADTVVGRMVPVVQKVCGPDELNDLYSVLEKLAAVDGPPTDLQNSTLDIVRKRLRLG